MEISLIIPVFNEADSLMELHDQIVSVLDKITESYEIVFIDDGSYDQSPSVLKKIKAQNKKVKTATLQYNMGKSAAYTAGFDVATGDIIITLDADLQDDPAEIPKLLQALEEGNDLVIGRKQDRLSNEPTKTIPSRIFNLLLRLMFRTKLHDSNSGFRIMRRAVASNLELYGDQYRFIPQLAFMKGFRIIEIPVQHRKRKYGSSKYGMTRFWTSVMDLITVRFITRFTFKPMHFFGTLGLIPLLMGVGLEIYVLIRKLMGDKFQTHLAALIIGVLFIIVGIQLIATGLIGEMLSAQNKQRKYFIRRRQESGFPQK
jgi:glycosyltransferase involved in cell wall biosynthesis